MKYALLIILCLPLRLLAQGQLDPSFGDDGKVINYYLQMDYSYQSSCNQSDGKYIVGGHFNHPLSVCRFFQDGRIDSSFATCGCFSNDFWLYKTIVLNNDKILVIGTGNDNFLVIRLTPEGILDSTFGVNGITETSFTLGIDYAMCAAVQSDSKIVAAGTCYIDSIPRDEIGVVRYLPDGSPDSTFGMDGQVKIRIDSFDYNYCYDVLILSDNKILLHVLSYYETLIKLNPDGSVDSSFGLNGQKKLLYQNFRGYTALLLENDDFLLAGECSSGDFSILKLHSDGNADTTFGTSGFSDIKFDSVHSSINSLCLQDDGKIVAVGNVIIDLSTMPYIYAYALARINQDGDPDPTFGQNGRVTTSFYGTDQSDYACSAVIFPDNKLLVTGIHIIWTYGDQWYLGMARYMLDNSLGMIDPGKAAPDFLVYPNPVRDFFTMEYNLSESSVVTADLFDISGKKICRLMDHVSHKAGKYSETFFPCRNLPPGNYVLVLMAGESSTMVKILVSR
ncbi:MAG: T9SS type A sorting domain-containing protein [Syntrophothermus sp.]